MATATLESIPSSFVGKVCAVVVVVGLLNFVVFVAVAIYLGGDAVNGKVEEGRYYLYGVRAESGRKVYTEVNKSVFTYSKWHVYSVWLTWPLMLAAGSYLYKKRLKSFDRTFDKLARNRGRNLLDQ